jgi:antitoxin component of RelBE/YafQ-DinJ toxin-antitoxin module
LYVVHILEGIIMSEAMVTAKMGAAKKAAGAAVLEKIGLNASAAINELYDYLIIHGSMPDLSKNKNDSSWEQKLAEAAEWFDEIDLGAGNALCTMSDTEIHEARLKDKGLL